MADVAQARGRRGRCMGCVCHAAPQRTCAAGAAAAAPGTGGRQDGAGRGQVREQGCPRTRVTGKEGEVCRQARKGARGFRESHEGCVRSCCRSSTQPDAVPRRCGQHLTSLQAALQQRTRPTSIRLAPVHPLPSPPLPCTVPRHCSQHWTPVCIMGEHAGGQRAMVTKEEGG